MDKNKLKEILAKIKSGEIAEEEAVDFLAGYVKGDGFMVDTQRRVRSGCAEVIYGSGKTTEQIQKIASKIMMVHKCLLVTRITREQKDILEKEYVDGIWNEMARTFRVGRSDTKDVSIAVLCAGTSDLPVAEEAREAAYFMGVEVVTLYDCGVAGIHRLLDNLTVLKGVKSIVVAAGMEGALPSVVGGLVNVPVIAVPTSVGYGASFHGLTALLGMLNTCANGVSVVNIDNGFGAGYNAALIAQNNSLL